MQELIFPAVGRWVSAQREWSDLVAEMQQELPARLCADLIRRAEQRAQQVNWAFQRPLERRFREIELTRRAEAKKPGRRPETKLLRRRLVLMNPAAVARELAAGLTPPDLSEYNQIVADLARAMPHPGIAQRYTLPPQALRALADQIAAAGRPVAQALTEHAQNLKHYAELVDRLRAQPLVQKGVRLLGSLPHRQPLVDHSLVLRVDLDHLHGTHARKCDPIRLRPRPVSPSVPAGACRSTGAQAREHGVDHPLRQRVVVQTRVPAQHLLQQTRAVEERDRDFDVQVRPQFPALDPAPQHLPHRFPVRLHQA
ncbi:MAG: hypothetical protein LOD90_09310, partial [Symbiobacteriaceae bacterium]